MKIYAFLCKILAVILVVSCSVCVVGRELLYYAFEKNPPVSEIIIDIRKTETQSPSESIRNRVLGKAIINAEVNDGKGLPFLCKYVKYRKEYGKYGIFYKNANQEMFFSFDKCACLYYDFCSELKSGDMTLEECKAAAIKGLKAAFCKGEPDVIDIKSSFFDKRISVFEIITDMDPQAPIFITVSRFSGRVVHLDALKASGEKAL